MKKFLYCESHEGGMEHFVFSEHEELTQLLGWMSRLCRPDDENLILWIQTAEVGEWTEHRLGVCVRIRDEK